MFESGCTKHAKVRGQLNQLLTWAAGNGFFVQISIKTIKRIFNKLTNIMLNFVGLTVVIIYVVLLLKSKLC